MGAYESGDEVQYRSMTLLRLQQQEHPYIYINSKVFYSRVTRVRILRPEVWKKKDLNFFFEGR